MTTRNKYKISEKELDKIMESGYYIHNDDGTGENDCVVISLTNKNQVVLSTFPEGNYSGSTIIYEGECIDAIRRRITDDRGGNFGSSYNDYWECALRSLIEGRCQIYCSREISEVKQAIMDRVLNSIDFTVRDKFINDLMNGKVKKKGSGKDKKLNGASVIDFNDECPF